MLPLHRSHRGGPAPRQGERAEGLRLSQVVDSSERRAQGWAVALVFLAAFVLFTWRAAPGVTFEDSGELAAAAFEFGVPHPPGFPFEVLVGGTFARAISPLVDDTARALNLFSALCAAGAAAIVARITTRFGGGFGAGLAAGAILCLAPTFAAQAVVTEVYAPATLLCAAATLICLTARRPVVPGALLLGLGCTAHPVSLLFLPMVLLGAARARREGTDTRPPLALAAGGTVAFGTGLLPYLYLPWAAGRDPSVNWGETDTLSGFLDHVLRRQYDLDVASALAPRVDFLTEQLAGQWPLVLGVGLVGLLFARANVAWTAARALLLTTVVVAAGLFLLVGFAVEEEAARVRLAGVHAPLIFLVASVVSLGWAALDVRLTRVVPRLRSSPIWLLAALLLAGFAGPRTLIGAANMRSADEAERYARELMDASPNGAIVVFSRVGFSDILYFPVLYLQVARGERPDLTLVDRALLTSDWYRRQLARRVPELAPGLERYDAAAAANPELTQGPAGRRRLTVPVLHALFDGTRPVVWVGGRPGEVVLGGREATPGPFAWSVGGSDAAVLADTGSAPWEVRRGSPWLAELRAMQRERDLVRARLLAEAGNEEAARALRGKWRPQ